MKIISYFLVSILFVIGICPLTQAQNNEREEHQGHEDALRLLVSIEGILSENSEVLNLLSETTDSLYLVLSQMTGEDADANDLRSRFQSTQLLAMEEQFRSVEKLMTAIKDLHVTGNSIAHNGSDSVPEEEAQRTERFFTDTRDGKRYRIVEIGEQIWMVENLNYVSGNGDFCYYDNVNHCSKYGRLYDFHAAKSVCPRGWKLPSKSDFDALFRVLGGDGETAFNALIEGGEAGFNALLGGWGDINGNYEGLGTYGVWWTSTESSNTHAWSMDMGSGIRDAGIDTNNKATALSVRCMRNVFFTQNR